MDLILGICPDPGIRNFGQKIFSRARSNGPEKFLKIGFLKFGWMRNFLAGKFEILPRHNFPRKTHVQNFFSQK